MAVAAPSPIAIFCLRFMVFAPSSVPHAPSLYQALIPLWTCDSESLALMSNSDEHIFRSPTVQVQTIEDNLALTFVQNCEILSEIVVPVSRALAKLLPVGYIL